MPVITDGPMHSVRLSLLPSHLLPWVLVRRSSEEERSPGSGWRALGIMHFRTPASSVNSMPCQQRECCLPRLPTWTVDCVLSLGVDTGESTGVGHFLTKEIK